MGRYGDPATKEARGGYAHVGSLETHGGPIWGSLGIQGPCWIYMDSLKGKSGDEPRDCRITAAMPGDQVHKLTCKSPSPRRFRPRHLISTNSRAPQSPRSKPSWANTGEGFGSTLRAPSWANMGKDFGAHWEPMAWNHIGIHRGPIWGRTLEHIGNPGLGITLGTHGQCGCG